MPSAMYLISPSRLSGHALIWSLNIRDYIALGGLWIIDAQGTDLFNFTVKAEF